MNKLSKRVLTIVLGILLLISVLFLFLKHRNEFIRLTTPIYQKLSQIDEYLSKPFQPLSDLTERTDHLLSTYDENSFLKKKNAYLEQQLSELLTLQEENAVLRSALSIKEEFSSTKVLHTKVKVRTPVAWYQELMLDQGTSSGIMIGMFVVSNHHVVGVITEVTSKTSKLHLLTNTDHPQQIPVKIETATGDIFGILTGYDDKKDAFIVTQLSNTKTLSSGDMVKTSGLDGNSVANLMVGQVINVEEDQDNLKRKVYVKSEVDFSDLTYLTAIGDL